MNLSQQQQAQHLYFQTDLNKSEIASTLGISRSTLHYWIRQYNWERLKKSAEVIPSSLAENCYQILGNFTQHLLSEERRNTPPAQWEINCMYRLTLMISKLKKRPALCESMEMMNWFTERVTAKDPELAEKMQPHITEYIEERATQNHKQYAPAKMADLGYIPARNAEKEQVESQLDEHDLIAFSVLDNVGKEPASQSATAETNTPKEARPSAAEAFSVLSNVEGAANISLAKAAATATFDAKANKASIREMIRGTATTGPGKAFRKNRTAA